MPSMSRDSTDSYDEFFAELKKDRFYGEITFTLKDGDVVHVHYGRSLKNLHDALKGLRRTHEEEPGVRNVKDLHQNGIHSQAR